uniref:Ig-like domain-containing protein n=1 Tax=Amazona collaria TaxID=241587 RepID=A0A8B9J3D3_9PSIT
MALALERAGVWAQFRLEETGGGLRAPGDSVLLSCRAIGFTFETYEIQWYRQAPGGTLEWVSIISFDSSVTKFAQSVESRASASRDSSELESSLSLRALQPQDSARYFCAVYTETVDHAELQQKDAGAPPGCTGCEE